MKKKDHSLYDMKEKNVFIRTVTHHYTGKIMSVTKKDIVLKNAAWIPDDGRFNLNDVIIMIGAILDVTEISELPRDIKRIRQ